MNESTQSNNDDLARPATRRRGAPWLLGGLVLLLLFALVAQQAFGVWTLVTPDTASDTLLLYALSSLNFAAFIVFAFIFVRNLLKLRSERQARQLGAKIKTRLVVYFIAVSLLPITAMAAFSYFFLNRSLEKWFSSIPLDVVREAKEALDRDDETQREDLTQRAAILAALFRNQPELMQNEEAAGKLLKEAGLLSVAVNSSQGEIDRYSDTGQLNNDGLAEFDSLWQRTRDAGGGTDETHFAHSAHYEIISTPFDTGDQTRGTLMFARARRINENLEQLIAGSENFEQLKTKQRKVRLLGLSTIGLLTLLLLFAATWAAIHLARGIAVPIRGLAMAADEVARGNLSYRVDNIADDELGLLAASFNQMTAQLDENRRRIDLSAAELREKNLALEERRAYIETVLESLSTGVISLDASDRVTTINAVALAMLRAPALPANKAPLGEITSSEDFMVLHRLVRRARRIGSAADQVEIGRSATHHGNAQTNDEETTAPLPVALTATALKSVGTAAGANREGCGVVLVIEDLSELLTAQRAAAWSEVARRMAHEIKNPLTPIQLSAERIARNFQKALSAERHVKFASDEMTRVGQVVEECTATICREVASLKTMVDEFSRFARLPQARPEAADLNRIIMEAAGLYKDRLGDVRMEMRLAPSLPEGFLDSEQLRRVFVNLIENSLEALADGRPEGERRITLASAYDPSRALLLAEVADTGHGIAAPDLAQLFQPYFSTRGRGTGLGLAIVQRIVTDHGGRIRAGINHPRGAKFTIELPIIEETREPGGNGAAQFEQTSSLLSSSSLAVHSSDHSRDHA